MNIMLCYKASDRPYSAKKLFLNEIFFYKENKSLYFHLKKKGVKPSTKLRIDIVYPPF